ncbi:MAG: M56 family metallopeptidase [Arenimonas sp.]
MSADLLPILLKTTLASSIAIVLVLMFRLPLRKFFGARVAYLIWCLVPLATIAVLIPAQEMVVTIAATSEAVTSGAGLTGAPVLPAQENHMPEDLCLLLWAFGIAACAYWFSRQQKKFVDSLGVLNQRYANVFSAENNLQGPSVIGVLQPRIVLPSDFDERYNAEEKSLVLTHEYAHVARGDTRINLLAAALRCVFWFNPLLHWADAKFRFDQELSTDAQVLSQFPSKRKSYADAMLKTQMASIGLPVACHWQAHHPLKERILMLKKTSPGKLLHVFGLSVVTVLSLTAAFAAWSTQPANIIVAQAKENMLYEIKINAIIDRVDQKPITLREAPGKAFAVVQGEGKQAWSYELSLTPIDNQFSTIKGKVKYGETLISEPDFKIANGKNAVISVSTKDRSSIFSMNFVASLLRNGKPVPIPAYNGDNGVANGAYMMQGPSGKQEILTRADLENPVTVATPDKIKMPAKMIPTDEFIALQKTAASKGRPSIKAVVIVDASGELANAVFAVSLPEEELMQLTKLITSQKFQAAIGLDGKAVTSKIDVEVYLK